MRDTTDKECSVYLDNIVFDPTDPIRLGRFWEQALGAKTLTETPDLYEARLALPGGDRIDLCFVRVPSLSATPQRLHLDLSPDSDHQATVERLRRLGARDCDVGQGEVPWVVLAAFCVLEPRDLHTRTGAIACLPLDSGDPARDSEFWSWLTGWQEVPGYAPRTLRHSSGTGPLLELCTEPQVKGAAKNRMHLDVRLEDAGNVTTAGETCRGACSRTLPVTSCACSLRCEDPLARTRSMIIVPTSGAPPPPRGSDVEERLGEVSQVLLRGIIMILALHGAHGALPHRVA